MVRPFLPDLAVRGRGRRCLQLIGALATGGSGGGRRCGRANTNMRWNAIEGMTGPPTSNVRNVLEHDHDRSRIEE